MDQPQLALHCTCTPVGDVRYDPGGPSTPSAAIIAAVAAITNTDPLELPPLYESVDPDAIDRLFENGVVGADPSGTVLGFVVDEWNVFVRDDGRICVCDPIERHEPTPVFD